MFDTKEQLLEKIRLGEDSSFELKGVRFKGARVEAPARSDLADELAAFANSGEGVLLLGVDDKTRQVEGIPIEGLDAVEALVRELCNDSVVPPLHVSIVRMLLPDSTATDRAVIKVDIHRSLFVHRSPAGYLRRLGSSRREMPPDVLARLFQQRSQTRIVRFDEQVVAGATLDDLAEPLWSRFRSSAASDTREVLLHKLGMARQDGDGSWRPTVAGVLMASADPRRWLPNAFVQAVAYRGTSPVPESGEVSYQLDAKDLTGPLDEQILDTCRFVVRNMRVAARKNVGRVDRPAFDLTAVFEAVVNAVAHRDYSVQESKVRLRMFSDRLVLSSPGGLLNTMTVESLAYRQAARNEALTSLLARCLVPGVDWLTTDRRTLMDKRGEGVGLILERTARLAGSPAVYRLLDDAELELTIPACDGFEA